MLNNLLQVNLFELACLAFSGTLIRMKFGRHFERKSAACGKLTNPK